MNNIRFEADVAQYLPTWYKNIAEYQQICGAESAQMELAEAETERVYGNFYISTMDAAGLSEWEDLFGLVVSEGDTLEFRRARVLNRLTMKPPFSIRFLREQLDNLIGAGEYNLIVDAAHYTLYVESVAESQAFLTEVSYLINHVKPAHIVYINTPLFKARLLTNETVEKSGVTYYYRLGSWGLGLQPFAAAEDMEVIKTAATRSITNNLLMALAIDANQAMGNVRLNGSVTITDATKSAVGNTWTYEYTVLPTDVSVITKIEILDGLGFSAVVSRSNVYIPIPSETRIRHTFVVEEGVNGD